MRKEAFNFITGLIVAGKPGMEITRTQATAHMLKVYNPGVKDGAQASCRNTSDSIFAFYIRKGILKRTGRGRYEIVTPLSSPMIYEEVLKELK